jgi:hypothetical protein
MSGWIKFEKDLRTDPRFLRMAKAYVTQVRITPALAATQLVGALVTLWCYADTHIREDDTLDLGPDEIDELIGIQGFVALMPTDWLEVLDTDRVKLPRFQEHNGTDAKKKALTAKRVARHRVRNVTQERIGGEVDSNACALPDQTRPDQDHRDTSAATRPAHDSRGTQFGTGDWFLDFKLAFPDRAGAQPWSRARKAANARLAEGHSANQFLEGARRYAGYCESAGKLNTEFVMQAATFLGPDKQFMRDWRAAETPATRAAAKRAESEQRERDDLRVRAEKVGVPPPTSDEDVGNCRVRVERAETNARDIDYRRGLDRRGPQPVSDLLARKTA